MLETFFRYHNFGDWLVLAAPVAMILDNFGPAKVSHFFLARTMPFVPLCNSNLSCARRVFNLSCARWFLNFVSEFCGARCFFKAKVETICLYWQREKSPNTRNKAWISRMCGNHQLVKQYIYITIRYAKSEM